MDPFYNLLSDIGEEKMLSNCYTFMTLSSHRPTEEQRQTLEAKFEQDRRYEELRKQPVSPEEEVKPDTLLENSCGICGASFVDHGEVACNEEMCLYDVRNLRAESQIAEVQCDACESYPMIHTCLYEERNTLVTVEDIVTDNWAQCDTCDSWRKIESTEGLPDKWYCSNIGKACRPPREAENHWPATRAKRFVMHFSDYKRAPNHMECLKFLAKRNSITLEQLYKTTPEYYLGGRDSLAYRILILGGKQVAPWLYSFYL